MFGNPFYKTSSPRAILLNVIRLKKIVYINSNKNGVNFFRFFWIKILKFILCNFELQILKQQKFDFWLRNLEKCGWNL